MNLPWPIKKVYRFFTRNIIDYDGNHALKYAVTLHYWTGVENLGDALAPVIFQWMLDRNGIENITKAKKYSHLLTVGSILGDDAFDATVWGSGIHKINAVNQIRILKRIRRLDVRAVRGPITRAVLIENGYDCPAIYGDPAILLPEIYQPESLNKQYSVGLIRHFREANSFCNDSQFPDIHRINVATTDYRHFIDEIVQCKKIISSSLHGIIIAEAYGVPAVFLMEGIEEELMKFYDWYFSTGRYSVTIAQSLEEAMYAEPMKLPDLEKMRYDLIKSFPVDLWKEKSTASV